MAIVGLHLGAGPVPSKTLRSELKKLAQQALDEATALFTANPNLSALDAACKIAALIENSPFTNAGPGSELTLPGHVECDASVVCLTDGKRAHAAVGALQDVQHPIMACRAMVQQQKVRQTLGKAVPAVLVGEGAREYARENGLKMGDLVTERARLAWTYWKAQLESYAQPAEGEQVPETQPYTDTIGVFVIKSTQEMACCASSGGVLLKEPGRLGPAAIIGTGIELIPGQEPSLCLCSGFGEDIITTQLANGACTQVSDANELPQWMEDHFVLQRAPYFGVLRAQVINNKVSCDYYHSTESMTLAVTDTSDPSHSKVIVSTGKTCSQGGWRFGLD